MKKRYELQARTSKGGALGWTADGSDTFPGNNLADIKHLRLYNRQLSSNEIRDNAESLAFMLGERYTSLRNAMLGWYRFNVPAPGSPTTISESSTLESKYPPVYPDHTLPTTYAYNSTNQVMMQHTPDGGTSRFWYDYLSRLTASQNAKQQAEDKYSYTKYDILGRITEVGDKAFAESGLTEPAYLDSTAVNIFLAGGSNSQITQTLYDSIPIPGNGIQPVQQENLRKRVAASVYRETDSSSVKQASYYNYDLNGNVKTLYQSVYGLGIKTLNYEYDLVSGKVNFLRYQSGHPDQFYYQYKYDAENRLTEAWSGTTALVRPFGRSYLMDGKLDASYEYYLHGPLARIELGDQYGKVQGMDYAYTLQGWLKGVNGQKLDAATEIGADGEVVAKDVLAYSLGYYAGDYKPIGGTGSSAFDMQYQGQTGDITGQNLYNGNISNTTVAISKFRNGDPVGYTYKYDQLSRLKEMRQHELAGSTTSWDATSMVEKYKERISYDGNGNILSFLRNGTTDDSKPLAMDNLTYSYNKDGNNRLVNNRLRHVNDAVAGGNYTEDLDDQANDNYHYDAIGNLIKDTQEGIDSISWTVYGKIKSISKTNGTNITYNYDPSGNRVSKSVFTPSQGALMTWYIRDAQGNTLGVYDNWNCGINWKEQSLYGSSRLGMWKPNINLNTVTDSSLSVWDTIGKKGYELGNHLGSVLAVISDKRILVNGVYEADVIGASDYYSFGQSQPGRTFGSLGRYGFNGKEKDDDIKGAGNSYDYGARMYDPRLGRWLSIDKLADKYPDISPFAFSLNTPIQAKDPDGNVVIFINGQHAGTGGQAKYWGGYDQRVKDALGDQSLRYVDGALGGWKNTGINAVKGGVSGSRAGWVGSLVGAAIKVMRSSNVNMKVRIAAGEAQGMKDAASIIANLSEGETIKIVTHSMGTGFARGYTEGIMKYAKANGLADKVKFEYELDVNSFQGADLPASSKVKRTDNKTGGLDGGKLEGLKAGVMSVPTVDKVPGAKDTTDPSDTNNGHDISTMSTTGIPGLGNGGKPAAVEQGNNNEKKRP